MANKRNRIISRVKSKYLTHTCVVRMPNSIKEEISLDKSNRNTLWWEAIFKEIRNVSIAFKFYEDNVEDLPPGYQ